MVEHIFQFYLFLYSCYFNNISFFFKASLMDWAIATIFVIFTLGGHEVTHYIVIKHYGGNPEFTIALDKLTKTANPAVKYNEVLPKFQNYIVTFLMPLPVVAIIITTFFVLYSIPLFIALSFGIIASCGFSAADIWLAIKFFKNRKDIKQYLCEHNCWNREVVND